MKRFLTTRRALGLSLVLLTVMGSVWWLAGCATVANMATEAAAAGGHISEEEAQSLHRTIEAVDLSFKGISPSQEYYIGRAVAAQLATQYDASDFEWTARYLNEIGQTLAMASDRPETYGGYHFMLLESDEINAFAAPGGLIMVSRGMLNLCQNEDELAAVLAHEIGHVTAKHGLRAIKNTRLTSALTILGTEGARTFGGEDLKQLVADYGGSVDDVTQTLVVSGYSRGLEAEADEIAITLMKRVGYDPRALPRMLAEMQKRWVAEGPGFARTHPEPQDRISAITPTLTDWPLQTAPSSRQERFDAGTRDH